MGLQWSRDRAQKKRTGIKRAEMMRKGLRMALGKVRRKGLHCPPLVRFSGFVFFLFNRILLFSVI